MAQVLPSRQTRPLTLLDLAVPRDIEPAVTSLEGVVLFDVMTLRERLAVHDDVTAETIERARGIVADEVRRYVVRGRGDALAPLITALRRRGDGIITAELDRYATRLEHLTPDERAAVEALARGIASKLLHDPIVELKERSVPGAQDVHARVLAELSGSTPTER